MTKTSMGKSTEGRSRKTPANGLQAETLDAHQALGHYEILEKIGQGGMAVVYKGMQPSLNRAVAIKVLPPQFVSTPELLARFDREASIVSRLNHSNIVQVIDRGKQGNTLYIVMEYVEGESLEQLIRKGALEIAAIIDYAMQICDGLEYAHAMGVVHRDLKPSNILIDRSNGRVKIADFGIAQLETTGGAVATLTYDGASIGTMNYMSPEQRLDAHAVTYLTDLFSFGVILYQMLTGKLPIGHFKAPSSLRPDLPLGLDAIVRRCLAEAPADRYQSAGEIHRELSKLTRLSQKIEDSALLSLSRLNKRQRWIVLGAAGGVLLLAFAVASFRAAGHRNDDKPPAALESVPSSAPASAAGAAVRAALDSAADPDGRVSVGEARIQADFARAEGLAAGGKPQEGVALLERLLSEHPHTPQAENIQLAIAAMNYAMGEKERCKMAYDRFVRNFPASPRVPEAVVGRCRAEWDTSPRRGLMRNVYDADVQHRLIEELTLLTQNPAAEKILPAALRLLAEIAEPPEMANITLAVETLQRVHALTPGGDAPALYHAAELLDRRQGKAAAAIEVYNQFLTAFPGDARSETALRRVEELKIALTPKKPAPAAAKPAAP